MFDAPQPIELNTATPATASQASILLLANESSTDTLSACTVSEAPPVVVTLPPVM